MQRDKDEAKEVGLSI